MKKAEGSSPAAGAVTPFAEALEQFRQGRFQRASDLLAAALRSEPNNPQLWLLAGSAAKELGQHDAAERGWRTTLALDPNSAEAHFNLGILLQEKRRVAEAMLHYRAALTRPAWHPRALNNLGAALAKDSQPEEALRCFDQAVSLSPDYGRAHHNRGRSLIALGRFAEARQALELAILHLPQQVRIPVYRSLSTVKRFTAGDPVLQAMEALAQNIGTLAASDQVELHFALGKAYDDLGAHARSFSHLLAGNREKRKQIPYDEAATFHRFERTRAAYSADLMSARQGVGSPSRLPVFIVGMPRSGSTLVEQILSSHPAVHGAGEGDEFPKLAEALRGRDGTPLLPDGIAGLPDPDLLQLGQRYLTAMQAPAPQSQRICDKNLHNFQHLGLIHLALPGARIIHVRRDAVETCLSCFTHLFQGEFPYTYDLAELGRYWRAYDQLMAHWKRLLPASIFLEVSYEDLVDDLEGQTRRLLEHCGLEWHPACLDFHQTQRPVYTASATQVRVPIYRSSLRKAKRYDDFLQPLRQALAGKS